MSGGISQLAPEPPRSGGQLLDKISPTQPLKPLDLTPRDSYRAPFKEMRDDSWKTM